MKKPNVADSDLQQAKDQFDAFDQNIKSLTHDRMNEAPVLETERQTKLSQSEIAASKDVYLKPTRAIGSREKFNEKFRKEFEFSKEYVQFIAENKELMGENIEMWTKPFPGMPAEFWSVPVNKPIFAPRYVAEQIRSKKYHRLKMNEQTIVSQDGMGKYTGSIVVDTTIPRLDAYPANTRRSVFS